MTAAAATVVALTGLIGIIGMITNTVKDVFPTTHVDDQWNE